MTHQRWNPHRTARAMLAFGRPVTEIAEVAVVLLSPDSATAQVLRMRDIVYAGDLVTVQR